jgi:hypothetical protein
MTTQRQLIYQIAIELEHVTADREVYSWEAAEIDLIIKRLKDIGDPPSHKFLDQLPPAASASDVTDDPENVVNFPNGGSRDDYFGVCPICQRQNGMLNDGREHWFICDTHMTKWHVGSNLFSAWQHLTKEESFAQRDRLTRYRAVEEFHPTDLPSRG